MTSNGKIAALLRPRSVAVFGGSWAEALISQSRRMGFTGEIWPVHPKLGEIGGHRCFRSVDDLPGAPGASFVGVNRELTIEIVRQLAARKAGGAICFASGFGEAGPHGEKLQAALIEAAGDMPVIGPNCYGYINYLDGALLWPDLHGSRRVSRGVAVIAQSSNVSINLTMNRRSLDLAYVVALGNQAKIGLADMIGALSEDPRVTAIGLYIEGISDTKAFADASIEARRRGKPIVALKVGRSEHAAELARSHTASLAGSDGVASALLRRLGVARVDSLPALVETLKLLHVAGPLPDASLVSLSCSGGEASIMADSAHGRGVYFPAFSPDQTARIKATVNPIVTVSNPFDYHTFDWGDRPKLQRTFEAVMEGPQALTALVLDYPKRELGPSPAWDASAEALCAAAQTTGRRAAIIATLPECMPEEKAAEFHAKGVAAFAGIDDALTAIEAAAFIGGTKPAAFAAQPREAGPAHGQPRSMTEWEAKRILAAAGVPVSDGALCTTRQEAIDAAQRLGAVAMKAVSPTLLHKTELNAVALNVKAEAVGTVFDRLIALGDAVLVEAMVAQSVGELIVGISRDTAVGLHMLIGSGGVAAELLRDTQILLLPAGEEEIEAAIRKLKLAPLLLGWRGAPKADLGAAVRAIYALQRFALDNASRLHELEVNPLMLCAEGRGVHAVDALMRMTASE
jgi:acyl-CoA synthetase (NDP forming)